MTKNCATLAPALARDKKEIAGAISNPIRDISTLDLGFRTLFFLGVETYGYGKDGGFLKWNS